MKIGQMRDRIKFLNKKQQTGAVINLSDNNYEPYKTVWSKVEYVSSKEIYSTNANNTLNVVKFIIRYRTDIKNDMRIEFDNDTYEIKGIRPLDTKKMYLMVIGELIKHE